MAGSPAADAVTEGFTALTSLALAGSLITTGLVVGALALYAHTIMPGLRKVDDRTFVAAFQAIDRAIINPWFMACFVGALVLTGGTALLDLASTRSAVPWLAAAFLLYLVVVVITLAVNVPLNDAIKAAGDPDRLPDLARVREQFDEARWARWHLVRTAAGLASFTLLVVAAVLSSRA